MSSVYEPREDSHLLEQSVRTHARGRVLDMGAGSGIQAFAALETAAVTSVLAVDINPLAVERVQERINALDPQQRRKIAVTKSDRFSELAGERFDTIICNPPYLPNEDFDHDPALYGGASGYEWSIAFLREAKEHLTPGGQILFLFSSLTNRDRIDLELKHLKLQHEELGLLADFFERLYVYRIWGV